MKKITYIFLIFCNLLLFTGCKNNNNNVNNSNIQVNRTSTSISNTASNDNQNPVENTNSDQNTNQNSNENANPDSNQNQNLNENQNYSQNQNINNENPNPPTPENTETIASEFKTQIKTKSKNRANNIQITCSKINENIVKAGEEFSFCSSIGVSKESEGYKKADVIVGKKTIQALGGGNCQVSSTLYNAVLSVPELEVTERHPHGKKINYVPEGKDAAIAHGLKDFKFKNNSGKDLKIYASSDGSNVYVKLVYVN